MQKPLKGECADFYFKYINELPEKDIFEILTKQLQQAAQLLELFPEEKGTHRYATGKWSVKEVIGHVCDTERVLSYRAMCFARNEAAPLPAMDENAYVSSGHFNRRPMQDILQEFHYLRQGNILLFKSFDAETQMRLGTASGFAFTVRALPYIIAGHAQHHFRFLKEHYIE